MSRERAAGWVGVAGWVAAALLAGPPAWGAERAGERARMMQEIEQDLRATSALVGRERLDPRVRSALLEVPRHAFVPASRRAEAYRNVPLPIGHGQTISQPYIVAIMTDLLEPEPGDVMFELGTGSGYQAAVLSRLVAQVYSMEIVPPLAERAEQTLSGLGYDNVEVRVGDGYFGWEEHGPFDGIVVTAAGDHVPPPLIEQLRPGARMVIPVGGFFFTQTLMLIEKQPDGSVRSRELLPVRFVPLTSGER